LDLFYTGILSILEHEVRYNPEGRRFHFRWCHWNFSLT